MDKRLDEWVKEEVVLGLWGGVVPKEEPEGASPATAADSPATQSSDGPKTKTEIRHEKEKRALESELNGFRKRKRIDKDGVSSTSRLPPPLLSFLADPSPPPLPLFSL